MLVLNNRNTKTYKTGYTIDNDSKAELAFRYRGVDREEIDHNQLMAGIEGVSVNKIIATTSGHKFEIYDIVKLYGIKYKIERMQVEYNENENGMFASGVLQKETYLYLKK